MFFWTPSTTNRPLDDINHVFVTHVFLDVFILNLLFTLHHLDPIHTFTHASCFMFHAHAIPSYPLFGYDVHSTPLHCFAFFVSLNLGFFLFLFAVERRSGYHYSFICWKGKFPPFLFLSFLSLSFHIFPLSTTYLVRRPMGPIYLLPPRSRPFFLTVTYLTYRL